jgi:hypothetical protein
LGFESGVEVEVGVMTTCFFSDPTAGGLIARKPKSARIGMIKISFFFISYRPAFCNAEASELINPPEVYVAPPIPEIFADCA